MSLLKYSLSVASCVAATLSSISYANAQSALASTTLNVRSGPGTEYNVVSRLNRNEPVNVKQCVRNAWCYVEHDGENGWVSSNYLKKDNSRLSVSQRGDNCSLKFTINSSGPSFDLRCSEPIVNEPIRITSSRNREPMACLYTRSKYRGEEYCENVSKHNRLGDLNNRFASVRLFNGAKVKLCSSTHLNGNCKTYSSDQSRFGLSIYKRVSSFRVYDGRKVASSQGKACFYSRYDFGGTRFCSTGNKTYNSLQDAVRNRISSLKITGNVSVKICDRENLRGHCQTFTRSSDALPSRIDDAARSIAVYNGRKVPPVVTIPPKPVEPRARVRKELILRNKQLIDLDDGSMSISGGDISFNPLNSGGYYVRPKNGAKVAIVDKRGGASYRDCKNASFSSSLGNISDTVRYPTVCVKTSEGRLSIINLEKRYNNAIQISFKTY